MWLWSIHWFQVDCTFSRWNMLIEAVVFACIYMNIVWDIVIQLVIRNYEYLVNYIVIIKQKLVNKYREKMYVQTFYYLITSASILYILRISCLLRAVRHISTFRVKFYIENNWHYMFNFLSAVGTYMNKIFSLAYECVYAFSVKCLQ